ncbi:MAG: ArnT family glycosyltransferase [Leptolyngbyaceae cyanobacterium]
MAKGPANWVEEMSRILMMWAISVGIGALWLVMDRTPPAWDEAEHLSLSMNYWWTLTHSNWLTAEGWRHLWMLSPKYPPVMYLVTAGIHTLVGPGPDRAMLANAVFALVLLLSTYTLGWRVFSPAIGVMAAGLTLLMPRLIAVGLDFQLDYAVTALVILSFTCLTCWREAETIGQRWGWISAFGLSYGLALMTKQSALLFLVVPLLWVGLGAGWRRQWGRLGQLLVSGIITLAVMVPWLSVNWLFQFSILGNTNTASARAEGDPMLNTLAAWTYYWQDLPAAVSWPLLLVPLVGIGLWSVRLLPGRKSSLLLDGTVSGRLWLFAYIMGGYGLWSAIVNKDLRYIAPVLPAIAVLLAWGLACWWRKWPWVTSATCLLGVCGALLTLFPTGVPVLQTLKVALAPGAPVYPYRGEVYPHATVVNHVTQTQPYQLATLGGLQSTPVFNQHNVSYYGKLADYQVYGRQVGSRPSKHEQDLRSLSWFYAQGAIAAPWPPTAADEQSQMVQKLEANPEFAIDRTWDLPNDTRLYLYRRQQLPVTVTGLPDNACAAGPQLIQIAVPAQVPPGQPMPVTYTWVGPWEALRQGLALLTWEPIQTAAVPAAHPWIHDHGIGLGTLRPHPIQAQQTTLSPADINPDGCFQVTERMATLPPALASPGTYRLRGRYVDTAAQTTQTLALPTTTVTLDAAATPVPAPDLDWVTQLREVSQLLPLGPDYLDEVFDPIGRLNLYDPIQNYLVQSEQSLQRRWDSPANATNYGYGLVLSQVLQFKVDAAIAALETLVQQDAKNPYVHAYLGFVNLYAGRPRAAQAALAPALALAPNSPEIQGLSAVAALFQGNVWGAWQTGRVAIALLTSPDA